MKRNNTRTSLDPARQDGRSGMFDFLKRRVYRTPFIIYTAALFAACTAVGAILLSSARDIEISRIQSETKSAFDTTEDRIQQNTALIDQYFLNLYGEQSRPVREDFQRFLGHTAEEYVLARLQFPAGSTHPDFIENIKSFVSANQYAVSSVACLSAENPQSANVLLYQENGLSRIHFQENAPLADATSYDIAQGYPYIKRVPAPNDISQTLGTVVFTVRPDAIFQGLQSLPSACALAVISDRGALFFNCDQPARQKLLRSLYQSSGTSGTIGGNPFTRNHYVAYTSPYGYKLIGLISNQEIFSANRILFLLIPFGTLSIFICVTLLISVRMSSDSRYLGQITNAIARGKNGRFSKIRVGKRKDEYSIIAIELNNMFDELESYIGREYVLKLRQREMEMKIMQQQINPHFLYNTLESIRSRALMNSDPGVGEAIYNLGAMFRAVIKSEDTISIGEELDILIQYLKIMEFKFQGKFLYQIDVDPSIRAYRTVKFWMQPLVENFFVHGFDRNSEFNLAVIRAEKADGFICMTIMDNGLPADEEELASVNCILQGNSVRNSRAQGTGIKNVYTRLRYFYGKELSMRLENNPEGGVSVHIRIPENSPPPAGTPPTGTPPGCRPD